MIISSENFFVQVNFIVGACENMISGAGMRRGDIITASNGKTIEVQFQFQCFLDLA